MTGKWNESMSYQPCDLEGEPLPDTELKEVFFLFCLKKVYKMIRTSYMLMGCSFVFYIGLCCFLGLSVGMIGTIQLY